MQLETKTQKTSEIKYLDSNKQQRMYRITYLEVWN